MIHVVEALKGARLKIEPVLFQLTPDSKDNQHVMCPKDEQIVNPGMNAGQCL